MYHFIYKNNEIQFDNYNYQKKAERFINSLLSVNEANQNINDLTKLQTYLNTYNNIISDMVSDTQTKASIKNQEISNLLTKKFIFQYNETINKANAAAYREYIKYNKNKKYN